MRKESCFSAGSGSYFAACDLRDSQDLKSAQSSDAKAHHKLTCKRRVELHRSKSMPDDLSPSSGSDGIISCFHVYTFPVCIIATFLIEHCTPKQFVETHGESPLTQKPQKLCCEILISQRCCCFCIKNNWHSPLCFHGCRDE